MLLIGCGSPGETKTADAGVSRAAIAEKGAVVIDVRTPEEYARDHVAGSTNVPIGELSDRIAQVVPDKNTPLYVHCQSGRRAATATEMLKEKGYRVRDLGSLSNAKAVLGQN